MNGKSREELDEFARKEQKKVEQLLGVGHIVEFVRAYSNEDILIFGTAKILRLGRGIHGKYIDITILSLYISPEAKIEGTIGWTEEHWIGKEISMFHSSHEYCDWNCFLSKI